MESKLIVALDVDSFQEAAALVLVLRNQVGEKSSSSHPASGR
jgi:hypothetical protein